MTPPDELQRDAPQHNRPLIQQAAGLILALRWVADGLAAFLLLFCYPAGAVPASALVLKAVFAGHAVFSVLAYTRYRRGTFSAGLVNADVLATTCAMLVGAHFAEGIYSPVLYLLLVQIASFVVIFGARPGRTAATTAAVGILLQAVGDAVGFWVVPGAPQGVGMSIPRVLDFATILTASAFFLNNDRGCVPKSVPGGRSQRDIVRVKFERPTRRRHASSVGPRPRFSADQPLVSPHVRPAVCAARVRVDGAFLHVRTDRSAC